MARTIAAVRGLSVENHLEAAWPPASGRCRYVSVLSRSVATCYNEELYNQHPATTRRFIDRLLPLVPQAGSDGCPSFHSSFLSFRLSTGTSRTTIAARPLSTTTERCRYLRTIVTRQNIKLCMPWDSFFRLRRDNGEGERKREKEGLKILRKCDFAIFFKDHLKSYAPILKRSYLVA